MRSLFPIISTAERGYVAQDPTNRPSLTPAVNAWDVTTTPLSVAIHVPAGERWLTHFDLASFISGPNAPTYQCAFGVVLRGATHFDPVLWAGPGSYHLSVQTAGDTAWGACSIPLWLSPGITVANFGVARDAGAVTLARRSIRATPYLGMKL